MCCFAGSLYWVSDLNIDKVVEICKEHSAIILDKTGSKCDKGNGRTCYWANSRR